MSDEELDKRLKEIIGVNTTLVVNNGEVILYMEGLQVYKTKAKVIAPEGGRVFFPKKVAEIKKAINQYVNKKVVEARIDELKLIGRERLHDSINYRTIKNRINSLTSTGDK